MRPAKLLSLLILAATTLFPQATVTGLKIHADPGTRVRPHESVALQVRVYGQAGSQAGRIRQDGAEMKVLDAEGGWVSKAYRFQGEDNEEFVEAYQSQAGRIFGQLTGQYVMQDAHVYTAPEQAGRYRVQAALDGQQATIDIEVTPNAPSSRKPETVAFSNEPVSLDPYRDLAEHWAPMIAQETWWQHKSDYITRFDFDGDWKGDNNWENLETGTSQAYVHYAAMETATHWFLIYNMFHPRDYSDKCVAGSCHENDNEGLILTVAKDGSPYGKLLAMETLAHNNIYSFRADDSVRNGVHGIDGDVEFHGHRPVVFIESGGHGVYGTDSSHGRYDVEAGRFTAGTGVTYIYKGVAERPRHGNDQWVGYELLPIYQEWWLRTGEREGRIFDAFFAYQPAGNRPRAAFKSIGGSFLGRTNGGNKAKPFWGWHDNRTKKKNVLGVGQWGLDPAYAASQNLRFRGQFSTDYVFNPYLALNGQPVDAPVTVSASAGAAPTAVQTPPERQSRASRTGGRRRPSSQPAPQPSAQPAATAASQGVFEVVVWVDGVAEVEIQGAETRVRNLQGAEPRRMDVPNDPMPRGPLTQLRLEVRQGRGKAEITERPSAQNGYTTKIRIKDPKKSGATYSLALSWKR